MVKKNKAETQTEFSQNLPDSLIEIFTYIDENVDDVSLHLDVYELGFWLIELVQATNPQTNPASFMNPYGGGHFPLERIDAALQNILTNSSHATLYQPLIDWVKNELKDDSLNNCKKLFDILWNIKSRVGKRIAQKDVETQRLRSEWNKNRNGLR